MCSWCYGFGVTPRRAACRARRHGATAARDRDGRAAAVHHRAARAASAPTRSPGTGAASPRRAGSPSPNPSSALRAPGFVYDTEPASRAVVTVRSLCAEADLALPEGGAARVLRRRPRRHAGRRARRRWPKASALRAPTSRMRSPREPMRAATLRDFAQAQEWGIRGFPALLAEHDDHLHLVSTATCRSPRCASASPALRRRARPRLSGRGAIRSSIHPS